MLVLTQKEGEILQVGDDVRIYIKRIKGNWVRLCIDAPRDVALKRIPAPRQVEEERSSSRSSRDGGSRDGGSRDGGSRDGGSRERRASTGERVDTHVVRIPRRRRA